jgi:hypothetical protein
MTKKLKIKALLCRSIINAQDFSLSFEMTMMFQLERGKDCGRAWEKASEMIFHDPCFFKVTRRGTNFAENKIE